jgi:hypothetical protein
MSRINRRGLIIRGYAGDYIAQKKKQTIFNEFLNTSTQEEFNPTKKDGNKYNENYKLVSTTSGDDKNCLIYSKSYELRSDFKDGKKFIAIDCSLNISG